MIYNDNNENSHTIHLGVDLKKGAYKRYIKIKKLKDLKLKATDYIKAVNRIITPKGTPARNTKHKVRQPPRNGGIHTNQPIKNDINRKRTEAMGVETSRPSP